MSDIPEGVDINVANIALAWEIVKTTYMRLSQPNDPEKYMQDVTNVFIKVHQAIVNKKLMDDKK